MPVGDALLKKPNQDKYREEMEKMDRKADEMKGKIHENINKKKGVFMGSNIGGKSKTYRDEITDNINKVKELRDQKNKLFENLKVVKETIR